MDIKTFRERVSTEPSFLVSYIVANNPEAVMENLQAEGQIVNDEADIFPLLNELLAEGKEKVVRRVLSVPVNTDNMSAAEMAVLMDITKGRQQANGMLKKSGESKEEDSDSGTGSEGGSFWNSAAFGSLLQGVFSLGAGYLSSQGLYNVPTGATAGRTAQDEAAKKARTTRYILIGVAVLAVIAIGFFVWKSQSSK
ncbi:MAG TPA: hypothetical protein PL010_14735 [Flavobacteriales bacterium]|nr:hypothetical protein [Flavobacteriales bacterium]HNA32689.1 hypothetical protein [Flavobacteriales bacterium]HNI05877.1 hypothetical protein [Flavobacteriales bacterium]HNK70412.1 hypothetical protein [Flavobacteriales bacterium]HNO05848.1 hypothetical protein [Flavobacteriales bacterium]